MKILVKLQSTGCSGVAVSYDMVYIELKGNGTRNETFLTIDVRHTVNRNTVTSTWVFLVS